MAKENNLLVAHGIAYGNLQGYACTFSEGAGNKVMKVAARFPSPAVQEQILLQMEDQRFEEKYRFTDLYYADVSLMAVFLDNPGTMPQVYRFIDWFLPWLHQNGALGWDTCSACGAPISGEPALKRLDRTAYPIHSGCEERMEEAFRQSTSAE